MVPEGMKAEQGAGNAVTGMNRPHTAGASGGQRIGPGGGMSTRSFTGSLTDVIRSFFHLFEINPCNVCSFFFLTWQEEGLCRLTLARVRP